MQSDKLIEEQLRPDLPARIPLSSTWTLAAQELMDTQPLVYTEIVARLIEGATVVQVSKVSKQPKELVRKIRDLHPGVIEAQRKSSVHRLEEALHNATARLADEVHKIPLASLPIATAVLYDKVALATGGATSRQEVKHVKSPEQMREFFDSLPQAKIIEIESK